MHFNTAHKRVLHPHGKKSVCWQWRQSVHMEHHGGTVGVDANLWWEEISPSILLKASWEHSTGTPACTAVEDSACTMGSLQGHIHTHMHTHTFAFHCWIWHASAEALTGLNACGDWLQSISLCEKHKFKNRTSLSHNKNANFIMNNVIAP